MIYPDLNIHQKINAKGNAFTLDPFLSRVGKQAHELPAWYSFKMISRVRKNDGNRTHLMCYCEKKCPENRMVRGENRNIKQLFYD